MAKGFSFLDTSQSWLTFDPRAKAQPSSCLYHEGLLGENKEGRGREKWQAAGSRAHPPSHRVTWLCPISHAHVLEFLTPSPPVPVLLEAHSHS